MTKLFIHLITFCFFAGQPCIAQQKPFVFTLDQKWHYVSAGVGLPLPTFLAYEYRLNRWSYGGEIGLIHTAFLANLRESNNTNPKNVYIRENLQRGISYSVSFKYHFSEKAHSFYVGGQLRMLRIGLKQDTPRAMIGIFAPDRLDEIENKLSNNRILNNLLGGKKFLDETEMQPNFVLMMVGVSLGKNIKLAKKLIFEPKLSFDFKINQSAKLDFDSDSPQIDRIPSSQVSPYITRSIKNQNIMDFLPTLSLGLKYELKSR